MSPQSAIDPSGDTLMLIDGHSLAFRAYHALPETLTTPEGEPIHAVYGFLGMLFRLLGEWEPRFLGVAYDGGRSFREDFFPEYKAGRQAVPQDIGVQVDRLIDLLEAFACWQLTGDNVEADDIIATLCHQARGQGAQVLVVTGDRDLLALVADHVRVLYSGVSIKDSVVYDRDAVIERFGVEPGQLTDWKALVGDPSDNIPGVPGVGAKTATRLLRAYGNLDTVYEHLGELTPALKRRLEVHRDQAYLSRRVVQLRDDVDVTLDWERAEFRFEAEPVAAAMRAMGFEQTLSRIPEGYSRGVMVSSESEGGNG